MRELVKEVRNLQKSEVKDIVESRLSEFDSFKSKSYKSWFSELCFCLLTSNSKAETALNIQSELGFEGFYEFSPNKVKNCIIRNKHRFHNNKTKFIVGAREHFDIKKKIKRVVELEDERAAREWLVKNIKGLGYKEASHFLRNVGYNNVAILDRHIVNLMVENGLIKERPKTLSKKVYLEAENNFRQVAKKLGMGFAELDLYMWYLKTSKVLK